jgi:hypothetical protein
VKSTFILIEPITPRGKFQIARMTISGNYRAIAECKSESASKTIIEALCNTEYTSRLTQIAREAAE